MPTLPYQYALDYSVLPQVHKDAQGNDVKSWIVVEKKVQMSGKHVIHAYRRIEASGQSVVDLDFDSEGTQNGMSGGLNVLGHRGHRQAVERA